MTAKEKAIQDAYGDAWEKVNKAVDENGWCVSERLYVGQCAPYPHEVGIKEFEFNVNDRGSPGKFYQWRPNSLSGIEGNNGWVRLDEKLPKYLEDYYVCINGEFDGTIMHSHEIRLAGNLLKISHWRPIDPVKQPIY